MKQRWMVTWYNLMGEPVHEKWFWTYRGAERQRKKMAPPPWLPDLFASIAERV